MADAPVLGASKRSVDLDATAFGARFHSSLVHESVRAELNARRRGTAATKTRGMVSGGGAKPWRQKGTGRARAGSSRSPIWTGGGTVFGPQPRSYTFKVNRKERRAALRSALSLHADRGSIAVLDAAAFDVPSTKQAAQLLAGWTEPRPTLVVLGADESNAALSFRNIPRVAVLEHANVGIADIVGAASLLVSEPALAALSARASGTAEDDGPGDAKVAGKPKAEAVSKPQAATASRPKTKAATASRPKTKAATKSTAKPKAGGKTKANGETGAASA
jgi:large subunit ribosomal protein L4